jgi:predicted nucleotidyltransferase
LIKKVAELPLGLDLTGTLVLFGSFAKGNASDTSDLDLFYLGALSEKQKSRIREIGRTYGREINVKTATVESFRSGLRTGDNLVKEIVRNHIILQNPDLLVGLLWRHYVEQ